MTSGDASARRLRGRTDAGTDVAVDLDRGTYLRHGAVVADDGETIVVVDRVPEDAVAVRLATGLPADELVRQAALIGHAFGNQQVGAQVWPEMQQALAVAGLDGLASYPVGDNRMSEDGTAYTGVLVQYEGDGIGDPHVIYGQLDEVKYQYGCFFASFLAGKAIVAEPKPLGTPCPSP